MLLYPAENKSGDLDPVGRPPQDYLSREEARQVMGRGLAGGAHTVCLWVSGLTMYPAGPANRCIQPLLVSSALTLIRDVRHMLATVTVRNPAQLKAQRTRMLMNAAMVRSAARHGRL